MKVPSISTTLSLTCQARNPSHTWDRSLKWT
jgi:hypothetical protein